MPVFGVLVLILLFIVGQIIDQLIGVPDLLAPSIVDQMMPLHFGALVQAQQFIVDQKIKMVIGVLDQHHLITVRTNFADYLMRESHLRSIIKAVSWRIFGTLATMLIAYLFTHELDISLYIGLFEFASKVGLFYFHERIWSKLSFGRSNL